MDYERVCFEVDSKGINLAEASGFAGRLISGMHRKLVLGEWCPEKVDVDLRYGNK